MGVGQRSPSHLTDAKPPSLCKADFEAIYLDGILRLLRADIDVYFDAVYYAAGERRYGHSRLVSFGRCMKLAIIMILFRQRHYALHRQMSIFSAIIGRVATNIGSRGVIAASARK